MSYAGRLFQVRAKNRCDELRAVVRVVLSHEFVKDSKVVATDPQAGGDPRFL